MLDEDDGCLGMMVVCLDCGSTYLLPPAQSQGMKEGDQIHQRCPYKILHQAAPLRYRDFVANIEAHPAPNAA